MKRIVSLAMALCAVVVAGRALAQTYPERPVRIVVPFAAAGPTDVIARLIADRFSKSLGGQFYVENRPGAGGNTGTAAVAQSPPDGHTLIVVSTGFVVNPSLFGKVPYDPVKDFVPISLVAVSPNVLTVHPSVPAKTVRELVDLIKANPGKYSYASPGVGSTPHLSGEMFRISQGIDLVTVQFTGAGPAIQNTLGGHTPVAVTALPPAAQQIKDGELRALMVTSEKRVPALPDVPTAAEAGLPGQEAYTLTGLLAPAGTPKSIVDLLHREVVKIVADCPTCRSGSTSSASRWSPTRPGVRGPHQDRAGEVGQGDPRRQDQARGLAIAARKGARMERPPAIAPELVSEFVRKAHSDLRRVQELLAEEPKLVNACWDWGAGDFEFALGAAAHTGRREIALFLLDCGARLDIFAAAMLGQLDVVKGSAHSVSTGAQGSWPARHPAPRSCTNGRRGRTPGLRLPPVSRLTGVRRRESGH